MNTDLNLSRTQGVIISLLVALTCGCYAIYLGQDKNWDLLNYHIYNPWAFLNDRVSSDLGPAGLQSWFNPTLDLVYFTAISFLSPKTIGFLIGFLQGLNFFLLFNIARRLLPGHQFKDIYTLLLALAGLLTVGFQAEIGTAMHDSLVALFPLSALWMVLTAIGRINDPGQHPVYLLFISAGFVAGIGMGLKLVTAIYALPLCLSLMILPIRWHKRFMFPLVFGISALLGLYITAGYWFVDMWHLFGNPLFPQYNNYFQSELAIPASIRDIRFLPKTLFDKVFYPVIFTLEPRRTAELVYAQYSWLTAYIAVLGLLAARVWFYLRGNVIRRPWNIETSYLLMFFSVSYLFWVNMFGIYRYLIVIELLIPLLLFVIFTYVFKTRFSRVAAMILITVLTAVNLPGAPNWGRAAWSDTVYRVEPNILTTGPEPATVYLAGQPAAWVIPGLDIESPFIQIVPNFPIAEAYWHRAKVLSESRPGQRYIIFESDREHIMTRTDHAMMKLGIEVNKSKCERIVAYIGGDKSEYRVCEIKTVNSE